MALTGSGRSETQTSARPPETIGLCPPRTGSRVFTDYGDRLIGTSANTFTEHLRNRETQRFGDLRKKLAILANNGFLNVCP